MNKRNFFLTVVALLILIIPYATIFYLDKLDTNMNLWVTVSIVVATFLLSEVYK